MPSPKAHMSSNLISSFKARRQGLEPYRVYDFDLHIHDIPNNGEDTLSIAVDTGALPNPSFDEIELGHGNDYIYIAGKARFEQITFTFKDFMDPNAAGAIVGWWRQHYNANTGYMGPALDYKKAADLFQYSPGGEQIRRWLLEGVWIVNFNAGSTLDFATSDIVRIELALRYDRAIPQF